MADDFLKTMAEASRARLIAAQAATSASDMTRRAEAAPATRPFRFNRFDVISEIKHVSPAEGSLSHETSPAASIPRATLYAGAGAAAISVLTEPDRFGGSLAHLVAVRSAVETPVMRKDFLVDAYQVIEARAHGADGVLLIARILDDITLQEMAQTARSLGMFALIEAFDRDDLAQIGRCPAVTADDDQVLVGLNCRDLATLRIDPARFETLIAEFPEGSPRVAESGIVTAEDAARVASLGYDAALVGTSLMRADDPAGLVNDLLSSGRRSKETHD